MESQAAPKGGEHYVGHDDGEESYMRVAVSKFLRSSAVKDCESEIVSGTSV